MKSWRTILSWDVRPHTPPVVPPHKCTKRDIDWDNFDEVGELRGHALAEEEIVWYGTCTVCGRRIEERYYPGDYLYDANTGDEV